MSENCQPALKKFVGDQDLGVLIEPENESELNSGTKIYDLSSQKGSNE